MQPVYTLLLLNNKLSYRRWHRDSAGQQLLRRSRSSKVTDSGTNRKPLCGFLLVNRPKSNLHPISHHLLDIAQY